MKNQSILVRLLKVFGLAAFVFVTSFMLDPSLHKKDYETSLYAKKSTPLKNFMNTGGRGPASFGMRGLNVTIPEGEVAYLDESTNVDILTINGELHCDEDNAQEVVELKAKTIYVNGTFQCGTSSNPYNKKLIISLKHSAIDPKVDPAYRGIVVMHGGKLILNGERSRAGWRKLGVTAYPGDTYIDIATRSIQLEQEVVRTKSRLGRKTVSANLTVAPYNWNSLPWEVGDKIAIGPTGFKHNEAEEFHITSISGNRVHLDGNIQYRHWGEKSVYPNTVMGTVTLDERAEVANLTRSIVIQGDESFGDIGEGTGANDQRGGHVMVHHMGKAYIDGVEFYKMGQAGVMARYPFHWHYVGNAYGQFVKNSSIHHSFQRCITVHRTNHVLLQNNVCYNFKGHGYFLEDGTEQHNKIIKNLAMMAMPPSTNKLLLRSDDITKSENQGRFPSVSGFWISHPNNHITHNVVSGSVGSGIWMSFEKQVKDGSGNVVATPLYENTDVFNYNSAHSSRVGITWDGAPGWQSTNNPNNPNDKVLVSAHYEPSEVPVFKGLRAWKNSQSGIYFRGQSAVYKNTVVADNGWSFWVAYNQIVRDSVFIGETNNYSEEMMDDYFLRKGKNRKTGMVLYDGPFEIHNSDFLDFSVASRQCTKPNGSSVDCTVVPFTSTGGSNKFINLVSGLRFNPEPIHRAQLEDASVDPRGSQMLANAVIRDSDGSLSGTGVNSVIVGKRSLGKTKGDKCVSGGTSLYNFDVCPSSYTEGSLAFMRWGSPYASPWATPFVVMRNDGATNYPIEKWNSSVYWPNNLFATSNNPYYSYSILPKYQYEKDRQIGATARLDSNTESSSPNIPLVKIVAYGNNCRLLDGAEQATSISDLKSKTVTSYYSDGEDFYVRIIPINRWFPISDSPLVTAHALRTDSRYGIECDEGYLPKRIEGKIENISRGRENTTIKGYACNYTHYSAVKVKVYAYGDLLPVKAEPSTHRTPSSTIYRPKGYTYISEGWSNKNPDPKVSIKCGYMTGSGRRFSITIPNTELDKFNKVHKFAVKGISNTGGQDKFIKNSNRFYIKPRRIIAVDDYSQVSRDISASRRIKNKIKSKIKNKLKRRRVHRRVRRYLKK